MKACGISIRMCPFEHFDEHEEQSACMLEAPAAKLAERFNLGGVKHAVTHTQGMNSQEKKKKEVQMLFDD